MPRRPVRSSRPRASGKIGRLAMLVGDPNLAFDFLRRLSKNRHEGARIFELVQLLAYSSPDAVRLRPRRADGPRKSNHLGLEFHQRPENVAFSYQRLLDLKEFAQPVDEIGVERING